MEDFWAFRKMITPVIIQVIFWIGSLISIILGIFLIANAHTPSITDYYGNTLSSWNEARYGTVLPSLYWDRFLSGSGVKCLFSSSVLMKLLRKLRITLRSRRPLLLRF